MVEGLDRLNARFARLPKVIREAATQALNDSARDLAQKAARAAPVDDGDLRESIRWSMTAPTNAKITNKDQSTPNAEFIRYLIAGNEATMVQGRSQRWQNAILQEYGTKSRKAQPYFRPSIRAFRPIFYKRLNRRISAAVKSVLGG